MVSGREPLRLRGHHICCARFWNVSFEDRGWSFKAAEDEVKQALLSDIREIQLIEGVDYLCATCPLRSGDVCASSRGGDGPVRKWDALLLKDLGVSSGTMMDAARWRRLVDSKAPFKVCQRCPWRSQCQMGGAGA